MHVELTGRQTEITPKLRAQAEAGCEHLGKMVGSAASCHVIVTEEKYRKIAEVTIKSRDGEFVATAEGTVLDTALHDALAKVEQQVVRHSQRQTTTRRHPKEDLKTASSQIADEMPEGLAL